MVIILEENIVLAYVVVMVVHIFSIVKCLTRELGNSLQQEN